VPKLDAPANAAPATIGSLLDANALAKGSLTARYGR
jgi:hypothetical protein